MDLESVMSRASRYVAEYEERLGNLVDQEVYVQKAAWKYPIAGHKQQRTESDFGILHVGKFWIGVREVNCVDGVAVKRTTEDFQQTFESTPHASLLKTLEGISQESARYNIGDIERTTNLPTFALKVLHRTNMPRFEFKKTGEAKIGGLRVWTVSFRETRGAALIHDRSLRDEFANGMLWIVPQTGLILKTELAITRNSGPSPFRARTVVSYENNEKLGIFAPVRMVEHYDTDSGQTLDCQASYFNFRRFEVETHLDFGSPVSPKPAP